MFGGTEEKPNSWKDKVNADIDGFKTYDKNTLPSLYELLRLIRNKVRLKGSGGSSYEATEAGPHLSLLEKQNNFDNAIF